jgi:hypothetical protein
VTWREYTVVVEGSEQEVRPFLEGQDEQPWIKAQVKQALDDGHAMEIYVTSHECDPHDSVECVCGQYETSHLPIVQVRAGWVADEQDLVRGFEVTVPAGEKPWQEELASWYEHRTVEEAFQREEE